MTTVGIRRQLVLGLPFLALWILGMVVHSRFDYVFDYGNRFREAEPYEWLPYALPRVTAEVLLLYSLLRPLSFRWSWGRVLLALASFSLWTAYCGQFLMHAPGWVHAHAFWLTGILGGLVILLIVSALGAWFASRRSVSA